MSSAATQRNEAACVRALARPTLVFHVLNASTVMSAAACKSASVARRMLMTSLASSAGLLLLLLSPATNSSRTNAPAAGLLALASVMFDSRLRCNARQHIASQLPVRSQQHMQAASDIRVGAQSTKKEIGGSGRSWN
jgi:hypothetical protein